jgi:O-methyltransferase involved in polyketide biosynthesis
MNPETSRISPTGRYTAHVWVRHGLSPAALDSRLGRVLHAGLRPLDLAYERLVRRPGLDSMLLARHIALDHLLARAVEQDGVRQILEIAAGFSGRGLRFSSRYAERGLLYLEGDLPGVATEKRRALRAAGLDRPEHRILTLNALKSEGPEGFEAVVAERLSTAVPTAFVTEGLLPYFDRRTVLALWRRFAMALERFPIGIYLSDLHLRSELSAMPSVRAFQGALGVFARGRVHVHFANEAAVAHAARGAGFDAVRLHRPGDLGPDLEVPARELGHVVRVLEARAKPPSGASSPNRARVVNPAS